MKKLLCLAGTILFAGSLHAQTLTAQISGYTPAPPWTAQCTATVTKMCVSGWRVYNTTSGRVQLFDIPANATVTGGVASGPINTYNGTLVLATVAKDSNGAELLSNDSQVFTFSPVKPNAPSGTVTIIITVAP